jgi:hypothetical protein
MAAGSGPTILDIVSLAVQALTPLAVVGLGFCLARLSRRVEAVQWANQTVVSRRVELFTQVAPKLNQLLCFATLWAGGRKSHLNRRPRSSVTSMR